MDSLPKQPKHREAGLHAASQLGCSKNGGLAPPQIPLLCWGGAGPPRPPGSSGTEHESESPRYMFVLYVTLDVTFYMTFCVTLYVTLYVTFLCDAHCRVLHRPGCSGCYILVKAETS